MTWPMRRMAVKVPSISWASLTTTRMPAFSSWSTCSWVWAIMLRNTVSGSRAMICSMLVSAPEVSEGIAMTSGG